MKKLLCLDCDSTLSKIEGVDELAVAKGTTVKEQVVELTNQAMSGEIAIEDIFRQRLELIQPTRELCEEVGKLYIKCEAVGAKEVLEKLKKEGWHIVIISGGFIDPILPFSKHLGIDEVHAVPLHFHEDGSYKGFTESPTTRNGGKPEIIQALRKKYAPEKIVMVGDGVSDLECQDSVDTFVGYGEFEERAKVKKNANFFIYSFSELYGLIV